MQSVLLFAPEDLPAIPDSLYQEYSTFGGGAAASQTYNPDYEPKSYFAEIQARAMKLVRRAAGVAKRRLAGDY
jgi:hypothetical protein